MMGMLLCFLALFKWTVISYAKMKKYNTLGLNSRQFTGLSPSEVIAMSTPLRAVNAPPRHVTHAQLRDAEVGSPVASLVSRASSVW